MHLSHIHEANVAGLERAERARLSEIACLKKSLTTPRLSLKQATAIAVKTGRADALLGHYEQEHGPRESWSFTLAMQIAGHLWAAGFEDAANEVCP